MTKREELIDVLLTKRLPAMNLTEEAIASFKARGRYQAVSDVDAILDVLMEPGETALSVGMSIHLQYVEERWQAILRAIKDGA